MLSADFGVGRIGRRVGQGGDVAPEVDAQGSGAEVERQLPQGIARLRVPEGHDALAIAFKEKRLDAVGNGDLAQEMRPKRVAQTASGDHEQFRAAGSDANSARCFGSTWGAGSRCGWPRPTGRR